MKALLREKDNSSQGIIDLLCKRMTSDIDKLEKQCSEKTQDETKDYQHRPDLSKGLLLPKHSNSTFSRHFTESAQENHQNNDLDTL